MTWFSWPLSLVEESVMQYRYIDSVDLYRWLENQLCNTAIYINFMLTEFQLLQQFNMNSSLILIVSWWQKSQIMQFRYIDFMLKAFQFFQQFNISSCLIHDVIQSVLIVVGW